MALSRRNFLLFASAQDAEVYAGPGKRELSEVGFAEDGTDEKKSAPVPVGAGSVSRFLARCVGCGKCLAACPREILRVSAKGRAFGRPALDFRYGWCRPECNLCAAACPAGAIAAKTPDAKPNLAVWHAERCVAATGRDVCTACLRHCPVKAITLVAKPGAASGAPKVPQVDAAKCIGCGACEHYCPARPKTAMSVEGRA